LGRRIFEIQGKNGRLGELVGVGGGGTVSAGGGGSITREGEKSFLRRGEEGGKKKGCCTVARSREPVVSDSIIKGLQTPSVIRHFEKTKKARQNTHGWTTRKKTEGGGSGAR